MIHPAQLFEDVPSDLMSVLSTAFLIFKTHWKPLFKLTAIQTLSLLGVALVLALITFGLSATYVLALAAALQNNMPNAGGYGRHLLDYSVGISGASRLLGNYYDEDYYPVDGGDDLFNPVTFILVVLAIYIVWLVVLSLVSSIFSGAFIHAVADIYAGNEPIISKSIRHGRDRMWSLYCFQVICGISVIILGVLCLGLPIYSVVKGAIENPEAAPHVSPIIIGVLAFFCIVVVIGVALAAAAPSIVIEGKSALGAFQRSWSLCKKHMCFIFTNQFCFNLVNFICIVIMNIFLGDAPAFFGFFMHVFYTLTFTSALAIIIVVIYMSMRIRTERVTQEDLSLEIGNHVVTADAVEMPTSKGGYSNVVNAEMI